MSDLIILSLLLPGPKHGYQLKQEAGFLSGQGEMHNNLIYPLLRRFTSAGWVKKKAIPGERGQTRQQYALTALGRRELVKQLSEYGDAEAPSEKAFVTRVGLFFLLAPEVRKRILDRRESYLKAREGTLVTVTNQWKLETYPAEVVQHLLAQIRSESSWIRRLRRNIENP